MQTQGKISPPPPPPMPEGDIAHLHMKIPTCLEELEGDWYELNLKKATAADIDHLDWSKAIGFSASAEGSEGVIFIEFEDHTVVSVKGSSTIAADMFALGLAHKAGICVPNFRTLRTIDDEYKLLSDKLNELDEKNNPLTRGKHSKLLTRPIILIMEFISGKSLVEMMNPSFVFGKRGEVSVQGIHSLQEIAKITVYDIVINNWDRIPFIWDNEGNPENILFTKQKDIPEIEGVEVVLQPVAIDNSVTSIDPSTLEDNYLEYLDKVRCVINEICTLLEMPTIFKNVRETFVITCFEKQPSVNNVTDFIKRVAKFDISRDCLDWFIIGFVNAMDVFSRFSSEDLEKTLDSIYDHVNEALPPDMTADSVAIYKVNVQFLDGVLQVFREAAPILMPEISKLKSSKLAGIASQ